METSKHDAITLATSSAYFITSETGVSVPWTRYGYVQDYAGFYSPQIRATGPWRLVFSNDDKLIDAKPYLKDFKRERTLVQYLYSFGGKEVTLSINLFEDIPKCRVLIRTSDRLRYSLAISVLHALSAFDGITSLKPTVHNSRDFIIVKSRNLDCSTAFTFRGNISWKISTQNGGSQFFKFLPQHLEVPIILLTSEDTVIEFDLYASNRLNPKPKAAKIKEVPLLNTVSFDSNDCEFAKALNLSVSSLYSFAGVQKGIYGVYAGFPWFADFWTRDTSWCLRAFLSLGNYDFVSKCISSVFRYQAKHNYGILGATRGELPMQYGPNSMIVYSTPDSTLYYPSIIHEYIKRTGEMNLADRLYKRLLNIVEWGIAKDIDHDGLIESTLSSPVFSSDVTWMDTVDRTAKPIEIESFWALTLDAIMKVGELLGGKKDFNMEYRNIIHCLNGDYWSENTGYFVDTIKENGSKDYRVRPNAILSIVFGLIEEKKALKAAERMLEEDMLTDWGVRTLSAKDSTFNPGSYHDGSVWPLDTGWVAAACFRTGLIEAAYDILCKMSRNITDWKGMYAELYRGDINEPYTSCINQAWSHAMFLWPVLDFMLGISPLPKENKLRIEPKIPSSLHFKVEGLSYGDIRYSIEVGQNKMRIVSQKEISVEVAGRIRKGDTLEF